MPKIGFKQTEETKLKMSISHLGHHVSEETRQKIRLALIGKPKSEETKEKLSRSHKGLLLGRNHPMFGKHHSHGTKEKMRFAKLKNPVRYWLGKYLLESTKKKMSLSKRGKPSPRKGEHLSEKSKQRLSLAHKGKCLSEKHKKMISESMKKFFLEHSEHKEKIIRNVLKSRINSPNKLEYKWIRIFRKHNLPYRFVGNGEFILGGKCPDFIQTNGKKICVEVRNENICKFFDKISPEDYKERRIKHFKQYGWDCIVIFEDNLKRLLK